jgi:drug/metabolite transporter (DMT)-like permease
MFFALRNRLLPQNNAAKSPWDAISVAVGAILLSLSPVFVAVSDVHPTAMAFYRVSIGGLAMGLAAMVRFRPRAVTRKQMLLAGCAGVALGLDLILWHFSIKYVGPGLATLLANGQVFILSVVGVVIFREPLRMRLVVSILLAVTGLLLIVGPRWGEIDAQFRLGVIYGLLTALTYSGYLLALRGVQSTPKPPPDTWTLFIVSAITSVFIGSYALANHVSFSIPDGRNLFYVFGYGLLCQGLGWFLISRSMPRVHLSLVGMLLLLQPLLAYVWDQLLFNRLLVPIELTGAALSFIAIYLGAMR